MQSVGKCNGNETLEMLPHSTRKCNKPLSRKLSQRPLKVEDTTDAIYGFVKELYSISNGSIAFQNKLHRSTKQMYCSETYRFLLQIMYFIKKSYIIYSLSNLLAFLHKFIDVLIKLIQIDTITLTSSYIYMLYLHFFFSHWYLHSLHVISCNYTVH